MNCGACGTQLLADARFCHRCGRAVGDASGSRAEQHGTRGAARQGSSHGSARRLQASVVFADVKGSMDLQRQVEEELWRDVMQRFFAILRESVIGAGGSVDKFTGDGIMAIFGAPSAQEDHAWRACLAALEMRDRLHRFGAELLAEADLQFAVRIGVNSGEALVGAIDDDAGLVHTALGHMVGLGQRMESLARPGSVYVTDTTARLVEGFFEFRNVGTLAVRGAGAELGVLELVGLGRARTPLDRSRARGFSPLVGREALLDELDQALESVEAGRGAVIALCGEAGVGKSRVCQEFAVRCRARGVSVHHAQAQWQTRQAPLLAILELVRSHLGLPEGVEGEQARAATARAMVDLDAGLARDVPTICEFLGFPDAGAPAEPLSVDTRRARLEAALRRLFTVPARGRAVVDVVEDLHAVDPTSEALLIELAAATAGTRRLLLVNFRPEYDASWLEAVGGRRIEVPPLPGDAATELLEHLIGAHPSLDGLASLVSDRTGGNPFYIEETIRTLEEQGVIAGRVGARHAVADVDALVIAPTVQATIAARIDRLGADERRVLQTAAVIGHRFSVSLLAHVMDRPREAAADLLGRLRAAGFLRADPSAPDELTFMHPLTQEVAFRGQLSAQRRRIHALVAGALEDLEQERSDQLAAVLADHWEAAGEELPAARWNARAAEWIGRNDHAGALARWRRIPLLLGRHGDAEANLTGERYGLLMRAIAGQLGAGWRLGLPDHELQEAFADGRALAQSAGDVRAAARLTAQHALIRGSHGHVEDFCRFTLESVELGRSSGDEALARTLEIVCLPAFTPAGRLREAHAIGERLAAYIAQPGGFVPDFIVHSPEAYLQLARGFLHVNRGSFEEGEALLGEAQALAAAHGDGEVAGWIPLYLATSRTYRGDPAGAVTHAQEAAARADAYGGVFIQVQAWTALSGALELAGEPESGAETARMALGALQERRATLWLEPRTRAYLSMCLANLGDAEGAVREARQGVLIGRERGALFHTIPAYVALARALSLSPAPREASAERAAALADGAQLIAATGAEAELAGLQREQGRRRRRSAQQRPATSPRASSS